MPVIQVSHTPSIQPLLDREAETVIDPKAILQISDWLIDESLAEREVAAILGPLCERLRQSGVPVDRARVSWPTLHPLFEAETVLWKPGEPIQSDRFPHEDANTDGWQRSPIKWMLDNGVHLMRDRLDQGLAPDDFPLFHELAGEGYVELVALSTPLFMLLQDLPRPDELGLYVTWSTRDPNGFSDDAVAVLRQLQRPIAVVCKSAAYPRLVANVANTYLGPTIAREVLSGRITLGSGSRTRALIWYSDLRDSTHLADTVGEDAYLSLLNDYFDCTGRAAVEAGGEIMAFIGDAVLAIFPIEADDSCALDVVGAATTAARAALAAAEVCNLKRAERGDPLIHFGIAMDIGEVRLGNIGISQRLSFSIIGSTVNEVERMEGMTKVLATPVLATEAIARRDPQSWNGIGSFPLTGLAKPVALYELADFMAAPADTQHKPSSCRDQVG
ncbi:adenylate/guanylate cyclase domain-containing protein [Mangrovicella endophytica]|uniref:adenylate/guanylate cyclase domain-containing protein n=1 Tax=Mangrovicella endophytica TaxID=2066697 RepID=UPI000C9DAD98|nr:adenylate/guanylate cyclase domain-containing protein [Mangrovicella endophytica]